MGKIPIYYNSQHYQGEEYFKEYEKLKRLVSQRKIAPIFSVFLVFNLKMKHEDKITQDRGIATEKPKEDSLKNK